MALKSLMTHAARRTRIVSRHLSGSVIAVMLAMFLPGCGGMAPTRPSPAPLPPEKRLQRMGFTIQAGAFVVVENAAKLADALSGQGLDAIYFKAEDGLFKVRFGDFPSKEQARKTAGRLKASGAIEAFYIISPGEYAVDRQVRFGTDYLRNELVNTAMGFIDTPYLLGGMSAETGFDCSGLTMTIYQLNGLNLPRNSQSQFDTGYAIHRDDLQKGDLVFFSDNQWGKVSHVGIYTGDNKFVHAPGRGKKIRVDSLLARYYKQRYVGSRSYF